MYEGGFQVERNGVPWHSRKIPRHSRLTVPDVEVSGRHRWECTHMRTVSRVSFGADVRNIWSMLPGGSTQETPKRPPSAGMPGRDSAMKAEETSLTVWALRRDGKEAMHAHACTRMHACTLTYTKGSSHCLRQCWGH